MYIFKMSVLDLAAFTILYFIFFSYYTTSSRIYLKRDWHCFKERFGLAPSDVFNIIQNISYMSLLYWVFLNIDPVCTQYFLYVVTILGFSKYGPSMYMSTINEFIMICLIFRTADCRRVRTHYSGNRRR